MTPTRCDRTAAWASLKGHFEAHGRDFDLRQAFGRDAGRFGALSVQAPEVFADLSKNLLDTATLHFLLDLARECQLESRGDAMFAGAPINTTEGRAVLHTALRAPRGSAPFSNEVHAVLDAMLAFVETVRDTAASGIRHIVNIGIGGSDLGPQMVVPALDAFAHPGLTFHFVANVDGHDITPVLRQLKPAETLFVIASKTFTTQETMANARVAKAWFAAHGGTDTAKHFVATTTNVKAAAEFGISTTFGLWDWVNKLNDALDTYFDTGELLWSLEQLDWMGVSEFHREVLKLCHAIPVGETLTYGQLARLAGSPQAARAVGGAMARNRWPLIVPCHRVVGSSGKLTGYSGEGGLKTKHWLLEHEFQAVHGNLCLTSAR